ncbi:transferase activity protein [[Candida] boidinii]|nr:transferase activity protein [[Candida] boidinii]OWB70396.1 transferase activity protein [[Candida] boidinii]
MSRRIQRSKARREQQNSESSSNSLDEKFNNLRIGGNRSENINTTGIEDDDIDENSLNLGSKLPSQSRFGLEEKTVLQLFQNLWISKYVNQNGSINVLEDLEGQEFDDVPFSGLLKSIQQVKTDLFNREYLKAWDSDEKREAYAIRWSSSRALAYGCLLAEQRDIRNCLFEKQHDYVEDEDEDEDKSNNTINQHVKNILCIGAGAGGEVIGLSSMISKFLQKQEISELRANERIFKVHAVDIANWGNIINDIDTYVNDNWIKPNNINTAVNKVELKFDNKDVLKMSHEELNLKSLNLITSMFTTNELISESKLETIKFLKTLSTYCSKNCLFLIVESAGSYSNVSIGSKQFPVFFLIDMILCGKRGDESSGAWEIVDENDSIWYRVNKDIDYILKLENMRFFYRLYRKK